MIPTALMDFFAKAPTDPFAHDLTKIVGRVLAVSIENEECLLRGTEFLEEIPAIAATATKYATRVPELGQLLSEHLLPIIFQNLSHRDGAVRKMAQSSLFALVEKNLITSHQIETQICPIILQLTDCKSLSSFSSDYITLMSQFVLLLGRDITEKKFLGRFAKLCTDKNFCVRKVCASHMGDFCAVIGKEAFDNVLLPTYITLCTDEVWGVRKSCAEVILYISCACSPTTRQHSLAPVFAKLLQDISRWVRISAFRTLGPFISTFADPAVTTLAYNSLGELVSINKDGTEFRLSQSLPFLKINHDCLGLFGDPTEISWDEIFGVRKKENHVKETDEIVSLTDLFGTDNLDNVDIAGGDVMSFETQNGDIDNFESDGDKENLETSNEDEHLISKFDVEDAGCTNKENLEEYSSYKYWYVSPELPLDPSIVNNKSTPPKAIFSIPKIGSFFASPVSAHVSNFRTPPFKKPFLSEGDVIRTSTLDIRGDLELSKFKQLDVSTVSQMLGTASISQQVVPQLLIDHFVSMAKSTVAEENENDMAFHCAYSLPAVALTLGSKNWHLIQDTVEILAANMQYKVRRTVACGLYELATILGSEIATNDLTPIFEGFIKDLDEVRIGVLNHLAHFLRVINPTKRNMYLPWLEGFLQTDNKSNWRFRQQLAEQLRLVVPLFRPGDVSKHISFLAQELLCDKVAAVREVALLLVTELIQYVSSDQTRTSHLLIKLAEKFAHSIQWKLRQLFALLCSKLLMSRALPLEQFACEVMPHLLDLSWDPVPNVRLVVARTIAQHLVTNEYFADASNQHYDSLQSVLRRLQSDKDCDVRQSAFFEKETNVE